MTNSLEIENLSVGYGGGPVLRDFSLVVPQGTVVAVLGPNGAGKTTLLRTISGAVKSQQGIVRFEGDVITGKRPDVLVRRGLAHVLEGRHIFGSLSVEENLKLAGPRNRSETDDRVDELYEIFDDLKRLRKISGANLSGGQQQMLAIARALMSRPRLLMLDEPSLGMAPVIVDRLIETIRDLLSRFDMSVLIVEQTVWMALALAQRVCLIQTGDKVFEGDIDSIDETMLANAYFGGDLTELEGA